jgi:thioredoxin 1
MVNEIRNNNIEDVKNTNLAVIDFNATWCGPCRMLAPIIDELSEEMGDYKFFACDVDENGDLAQMFGIQSIPAVGVFKDGKLVDMVVGFRPKDAMKSFISSVK